MAAHALHVPAVPLYNETDGANGDEEVENVQLCLPRCSRGTIKRHCCTWNVYWGAVIWCSLVVTYLLVGGGLFYAAERPHEEDEIDRARREREVALDYLTEVFVNLSNGPNLNLSEQAAGALVDELAEFFDQLDEIPAESSPSWEYGTSVFFAITVITTIGYGNIAPATTAGRAIFCFYALIGIPLALVFLGYLGHILGKLLELTLSPFLHKFPTRATHIRIIGLTGAFVFGVVLFVLFPALIFSSIESWTYGEAFYYCIVTLTTVGFGDFVPAQRDRSSLGTFYRICSGVWIWFGLACVALLIAQIQTTFQKAGERVRKGGKKPLDAEKMELQRSEEAQSPDSDSPGKGRAEAEIPDNDSPAEADEG